ncbi:hypothetical protein ACWCPQ_33625 [Nocardia sp. NPDC001965]
MNNVNAALLAIGGLVVLVLGQVMISMASKEIEGRVDRIGYLVLRGARRRLPTELRKDLHDHEWLPEMDSIMARHKDQPITRLWWSLRFSFALLLFGAPRTARVVKPRARFTWVRAFFRVLLARSPEEHQEARPQLDKESQVVRAHYARFATGKGGKVKVAAHVRIKSRA